ncbi:MAG TPA: MFS transporter [Ilumatobacteraceae bacterium]|nr:MFS transporter [Ilumatobacteraceae bacterium]
MASGSLRDESAFVRWAFADGVSVTGTAVSTVVLPIIVFQATKSPALTGGLFALRVVPYMLFGVVAGPIADRWNRRRLIIGGHIIEGILVATIPIASWFGVLTVAQVYIVGLLAATSFVFSDAAVFGAVPALVGTERLAAANGLLGSIVSGAEIIGPALGGFLASAFGPTNAVWIDAASFFVAAGIEATIKSNFRVGVPEPGGLQIRAQIKRAVRFVRANRSIAVLLLTGFGNSFGFGIVIGLLVPYAVQRLALPDEGGRLGLLYSAAGVGALLAGLMFSRLFAPRRVRWMSPATVLVAGLMVTGLSVVTNWVVAAMMLVVFAWANGLTVTSGITYRQLATPDDLRSSVNVFGRMVSWGGQPFGAATGALVAANATVRSAYVVAAVVLYTTATTALVLFEPSTDIITAEI